MTELQTSFSFAETARSGGSQAVAASIAEHYAGQPTAGGIVIVVGPDSDRPQVIAGGTDGPLRAAISAAVSAGHRHLWDDAANATTTPGDTTATTTSTSATATSVWALNALPDNVRAATSGAGVVDARIGLVRSAGTTASFAIWFDTGRGLAGADDRTQVMQLLAAAAERDREHAVRLRDERAAQTTVPAAIEPTSESEPDPDERVVDSAAFEAALDQFEGDEAVLILFDLDDFERLAEPDATVRTVIERLVASCRATDVVARLDARRFALLLGEVNRSAAMAITQRIHGQLASPDDTSSPISATVAFAHQDGLLDLEDMLESAERAIATCRRGGPGRIALAC